MERVRLPLRPSRAFRRLAPVVLTGLLLLAGPLAWPEPAGAQVPAEPPEDPPGEPFEPRPPGTPPPGAREVVDLSFIGNRAFSDGALRTAIETRQTRCRTFLLELIPICPLTDWGFAHERGFLDERALPADLLRLRVFYRQRGYREVRVDTVVRRLDGRARVQFLVEEGEPTRLDSLRIIGLEGVLDPERTRQDLDMPLGEPFNRVRLEAGKQLIRDRLLNRGYVSAAVLEEGVIDPETRGAHVTLEVYPGPRARIGEIQIGGTREVADRVVRQFLTFQPGDFYSQERVVESQRALFDLGAVRFASISRIGEPGPADSVVDVRVQVTEAPPRTARLGSGASTTECFLADGRLTHRNFLGGARRLELSGRLSNIFAREFDGSFPCTDVGADPVFQELNFRLQGDFRQPYFLSGRNALRGVVFMERETVPDLFVRTSRGADLSVTRRLRSRMFATLSYRPELTSFEEESADIFFCISFGFCRPEDITVLTEARWLAPIGLAWRYDRTDAPFQPTRGYYASAEVERAESFTGSAFGYVRFGVEAAHFESLGDDLVAAVRARVGLVEPTEGLLFDLDAEPTDEVVHPRKRFFGGGPQSVRGVGLNLLGPAVLVVDSVAHCPDVPVQTCAGALAAAQPGLLQERPVGGNAAYEMALEFRQQLGGPWGMVGFVDVGQVLPSIRRVEAPLLTPGLGVRYRSPVGPLRIDVGYNPTSPRRLPVVAQLEDGEIRALDARVSFDRFTYDDPGTLREVFRRLQIHLSIGEAF